MAMTKWESNQSNKTQGIFKTPQRKGLCRETQECPLHWLLGCQTPRAVWATVRWPFGRSWDSTRVMESRWFGCTLPPRRGGQATQGLAGKQTAEPSPGDSFPRVRGLSKVAMHRPCSVGQGRIFLINCLSYKFVIANIPGVHPDKLLKCQFALPGESRLQPGDTQASLNCLHSTPPFPGPTRAKFLPGQQEPQGQTAHASQGFGVV